MHILFLSRWYPHPPDNGSKIRISNLLRGLAEKHQLSLISFFDPKQGVPDVSGLGHLCHQIQLVPYKEFEPGSRRARLGFLSLTPRSYLDTASQEMRQFIRDAIAKGDIDVVIASQIDTAVYAAEFQNHPSIFEEVEIGVLHDQCFNAASSLARMRSSLTWWKHRRFLANLASSFRACTVVSERERGMLAEIVHGETRLEVIPNSVNLAAYAEINEAPLPDSMIFTGSFTFKPNYEAMQLYRPPMKQVLESAQVARSKA